MKLILSFNLPTLQYIFGFAMTSTMRTLFVSTVGMCFPISFRILEHVTSCCHDNEVIMESYYMLNECRVAESELDFFLGGVR